MAFAVLFASLIFGFASLASANGTNSIEPKNVVILGDSMAAGLGVDFGEAYPELLQQKIDAEHLSFQVVNASVSGDTSADGLARLNWLLRRRVDILVLELGGNDGLRGLPVSGIRTNLQMIINRVKAKYPAAQVVIAGMQMPANMGDAYCAAFRQIFPDLAATNHTALIPFLLDNVAGKPELNQPDHIHPTAEGHKIVADNVWKVLEPILSK